MSTYNVEKGFTNFNVSEEKLVSKNGHQKKDGCFITKKCAAGIVLAFIIIIIVVVLAVYYGHPDRNKGDGESNYVSTTLRALVTPSSIASPTSTATPGLPESVRLPEDIKPIHYIVRVRPDIYSSSPSTFRNNGTVDMTFRVISSTKNIVLHYKQMEIDVQKIVLHETMSGRELSVDKNNVGFFGYPYNFINIPVNEFLQVNTTYVLHLNFSGPILRDLIGMYFSSYVADNGETVYLLGSQFQVTDARKAFPCMDEPALKAQFYVIIERRSSKQSKSNMMLAYSENLSDGWIADHYEVTPVMSTYILAFHVSDFICVENYTSAGKLVEICSRPNAIKQTVLARAVALDIQEYFESYFDIEYTLNKTSHVALPDFGGGAMENWGLIYYREEALLYDVSVSENKVYPTTFISHELAHMWFGNLVTPAWWDDLWLNEGFAVYAGLLGINNTQNAEEMYKWKIEDIYVTENMRPVMIDDSYPTSHPVYSPVDKPDDIYAIFDIITYYKGAAVVRMMKYFLGEHTFRWGVSNYLKDRSFKSATHQDLFDFLSMQSEVDGSNLNVSAIVNTWIKQMGYPVLTLSYNKNQGRIDMMQEYFLLDTSLSVTQQSPYNYRWIVPVTYMSDQSGVPDIHNLTVDWLYTQRDSIHDVSQNLQWIIGNVGQTFFYRVNYNVENWNALALQLLTNHTLIPVLNRAQILDDAFNLGRAGYMDQVISLSMTQYMDKETEIDPWQSFEYNLDYITNMLYQSPYLPKLRNYIWSKVRSHYSSCWGNNDTSLSNATSDQLLCGISLRIACSYGLKPCVDNASNMFLEWKATRTQNETKRILFNFAEFSYCYGIKYGGTDDWDLIFHMFQTSNSNVEQTSFLKSLACSSEPWVIQRFLEWTFFEKNDIKLQDVVTIVPAIAANPVGLHIAWNYITTNWNSIMQRWNSFGAMLPHLITEVTKRFSTEWELSTLQLFINENRNNLRTTERVLQQAVEAVTTNIKWRSQNEQKILNWLENIH